MNLKNQSTPSERLKLFRKLIKISQGALADRLKKALPELKVTQPTYSHYESDDGKVIPSSWLIGMSEEFSLNPTWLLTGKGKPFLEEFTSKNIGSLEGFVAVGEYNLLKEELNSIKKLSRLQREERDALYQYVSVLEKKLSIGKK